jgi:predicted nucleotidyltransferase component of viral defense system
MLDKRNYELEYIKNLQDRYKRDPGLIERILYAFGLLEALQQSGMPFCFKGGTSLMLLLEHPMRLSTDIDIIVQPGTDVDKYIVEAGKIFPFLRCEEQIRIGRNKIEKRHFKFIYQSPISKQEFYILLDILFGEIPYVETIEKEIKNEFLLTTGAEITVVVPSADCILGDKLTAFAPHTTGIPVGVGKSLEIAKQLFDVATLTDVMKNHEIMRCTYDNAVAEELAFRGLDIGKEEVLMDTINACISIISRGTLEKDDYPEYIAGIQSAASHIIAYKYSGEIAAHQACKVMYLATGLLKNKEFVKIENPEIYLDQTISNTKYKKLTGIKKQKLEAYGYLYEAVKLLDE